MEKDNTYRKLEKDFAAIRDERGTQANTANRIGSAFLSLLSYIGSAAFLRKDVPDTAEQVMTFLKGIVAKAVSYFQGIVNKGDIKNNGDITNTGNISNAGDITNSGNIMTNNLTVTGKAIFFELEIQKAKAAGGMSVNSAGTFHVDAVEETPDGFVCYQRAEKDGVKLLQTCEPKDQMMCSNGMNILEGGKGNHYYWRLATEAPKEVVMHTIDGKEEKCLKLVLSKTDHSDNTIDIPKVGDDLVQIGNRDNKERQSVMMSCAYNSFDPELKPSYWAHYMGVNDYDISKHRYTWFAANGSQVTGNFKVQSDNGEPESIEEYMKGLASNNVVYKLVMSSSQFNVKADGSFSPEFISIYAYKVQGENLTQLSPSEKVSVLVTKGENNLPLSDKSHVAVLKNKWNLWAKKEDMTDVLNVDLFINDNVVDKQKLVDMQKIHIVRDGMNGQDAKVWHVAFSIRNITGKKGETFRLKYGRTVGESTSWYDDSPTNHGFNQLYAVVIDGATGNKQQAELGVDLNVADFFTGGSMTVRLMNRKTGETLAQDTIYPEAKQGKDAVSYKLIPSKEIAVAYIDSQTPRKKVKVEVGYFIQKTVGDVTTIVSLYSEGLTLRAYPALGDLKGSSGIYGFGPVTRKYDSSEDIFSVTLLKGNKILDKRTIPLVMKPKVVFDIDTVNGKITSQIEAANGKINSVERDLNQTKATVGELDGKYSQLKMKSDGISLTVNNGTRPNLLWGSDLDLSEVQDKIQLAYDNGDVIQKNTAKKEELQRQLDATPTNDTAKRNELQTKINVCDKAITAARNKISECKAAIHKHLGVGLNSTKIDSREWFEYLKGRGISGADALKFKAMKGTAEFTGLFWEVWSGGTRNLQLKPNTVYTLSAWVRTEFDTKAQGYSNFVFEAFKARKEDLGERVGRLSFKKASSWFEPINEWTRVSATFTTEELKYGSVAMWVNGTKPATLYICRPKLEEGNTATPWCAYDGTVEALLASGLDIKEKKFTATADNFVVQNNRGEQTFLVDKNGIISGLRIAQPFDVYNSNEEWRNGKSYSWYINKPIDSENSVFSGSYLDGACVNIYNGTAEEVIMIINICFQRNEYTGTRSALVKLILKPAQLFRAIGVRQQTDLEVDGDYITFYPLVPFTLEKTQASEIAKYLLRVRDVFDSVMEVGETYGGIVEKLKVSGIYKGVETLTPSSGYSMKSTDTTIVADTAPYRDAKITLPKNPQVGMEVEIINIGTGFCYLETADNTRIFWNEAKTKETVREHTKISLLYVGGSDNLWIYTTEGVCGEKK